MDKKTKIAIVLIVLILIGTAFVIISKINDVVSNNSGQSVSSSGLVPKENNQNFGVISNLIPELNCQNGWQEYHQDTMGIAFCYPIEWGTPSTDPIKNITRISNMKETFETQNIYYENALNIIFEKNNQVHIRLFNDQYSGKSQRDINEPHVYYESGTTDDVASLKNGGSICDYKIGYDYRYNPEMKTDTLKTIYANCSNGVRTVLTQDKEFFGFDNIGALYTYDLRLLFFKKLSNGYFDNVLVSHEVDTAHQIHEELGTLEEFFNGKKTTNVEKGIPTKTEDQFNQEKKEFEQFTKTIAAFKPVPKVQSEFNQIAGEDQDITTIRKYYWLIASGKLDEAYTMYADKAGISIDKFKERYGNAYSAEPFDFKNTGKNRHEFHVKYQDHNSSEMEFRVTMDVADNIVKTIFLEEYMTDVAKFGNITAYSARRGNKNYVFLNKDGKEIIVNQGDAQYDSEYKNISDVKYFSDPQFSPNGNYLVYTMSGWEWSVGYIYDIQKNKKISGTVADDLSGASIFDFAADENNFYMCSSAGMASGPGGKIYSVPEFKTEYDVLNDPRSKNFMSVDCLYDKNSSSIIFKLSDYSDGDNARSDKTLTLQYNLITKKVE